MSNILKKVKDTMRQNPIVTRNLKEEKKEMILKRNFIECIRFSILDMQERDVDFSTLTLQEIMEGIKVEFQRKKKYEENPKRYIEAEKGFSKIKGVKELVIDILKEFSIEYRQVDKKER